MRKLDSCGKKTPDIRYMWTKFVLQTTWMIFSIGEEMGFMGSSFDSEDISSILFIL